MANQNAKEATATKQPPSVPATKQNRLKRQFLLNSPLLNYQRFSCLVNYPSPTINAYCNLPPHQIWGYYTININIMWLHHQRFKPPLGKNCIYYVKDSTHTSACHISDKCAQRLVRRSYVMKILSRHSHIKCL